MYIQVFHSGGQKILGLPQFRGASVVQTSSSWAWRFQTKEKGNKEQQYQQQSPSR